REAGLALSGSSGHGGALGKRWGNGSAVGLDGIGTGNVEHVAAQAFVQAVERRPVAGVEQRAPAIAVEQVVQVLEEQAVRVAKDRVEQTLLLGKRMHAQAQGPWADRQGGIGQR